LNLPKKARPHRTTAALAIAAVAPAAAFLASSTASSAATPAPNTKVSVPQGTGPAALSHASVFGTTPASTPETVSFILKERNLGQLITGVESGRVGHLSVAKFASRYGQPGSVISALQSYLAQFGISATAYADGVDVTATGTAGEFDSALSVQQKNYSVPAVRGSNGQPGLPAQRIHGTTQAPMLPYRIARNVLSVLGLTNYSSFVSNAAHTPANVSHAPGAVSHTHSDTSYTGNLTPGDFAKNYGLGPLYSKGATGQGKTVGIVTLASLDPSAPYYFWGNVLGITVPANRITVDNVDGGPGAPSETAGSGETDLDVEQSGAIAPDANIAVYQAPNTDYGFADAFFAAASQDTADTVSTSWGESETYLAASVAAGQESPLYVQAYDEAFLELAAQGQTTFAASGDSGAYDASRDLGSTDVSVDNPGDSPFITAAGGTTLGGTISTTLTSGTTITAKVPAQRTWGWDWLWPLWQQMGGTSEASFAESNVVGGGGGFSKVEPAPQYQEGVSGTRSFSAVPYLTPTTFRDVYGLSLPTAWSFTPTPPVTTGHGTGRAVPDLSADADPFTGYLLYDPLSSTALQGGWGGTSFVAPELAGSTAVIDQYVGGRTGFWNPSIYAFARSRQSPFTPLSTTGTSNDNLYYTGTPGQTFNAGSGLGIPNLSKLAADFAGAGGPSGRR
jgi:subtilase family serine protease